jgi:TrmH family RNA methyltransferase
MDLISSRNNSKIKRARALRGRKSRQERGAFLVEGIRHVGEAVEAGAEIEAIFYAPDLLNSEFSADLIASQAQTGVDCYATTSEVFETLASKENPQGILAVVRRPEYRLDDLTPQNFPWGVALVVPQDPGNVGTILRTLDAVGASGLLLLDEGVDPYHPSAVRASMGTMFWHPIIETNFSNFAYWAGASAYHVYGTSAHGDVDYSEIECYLSPRILLMGSEREGLTPEQSACCERLVCLPMLGRATSLNLAVATGVMLYLMLGSD